MTGRDNRIRIVEDAGDTLGLQAERGQCLHPLRSH
jgi:hypothetical protein